MNLEAELWREVCQHLELEESVTRIAAILAECVPLEALLIRRLHREPLHLTTVACGSPKDSTEGQRSWSARTDFDDASARELDQFLDEAEPAVLRVGSALSRALLPRGLEGPVVALPLTVEGKPVGVALLVIVRGVEVGPEDLDIIGPAKGPLGVAFENDQRLHELARMREALEADRAALLSRLQRQEISDVVIGESGGLQSVMERAERVASTDAPVLLLGETGSGKEVIARAIHARSRRAKGPIVRVNCGAIPAELVDSELFGHERGSFTGAVATRKGWFERADGGTLFLDEIGELPLAAQVRLLRVLQDGTLERVGGHQTISVDVRIVAATHRHLESMVAAGLFREDLWYRLSVFPIRLPALRERLEDLPALAAHFADGAGKRLGGAGLVPTPADIELLRGYAWPGNVRELAAVIERAAILGDGKRLELRAALGPTSLKPASPPASVGSTGAPPTNDGRGPQSIATLDEAMAAHICHALEACHGRIEGPFGAAKILDINPHTLRARMRKLGVEWSRFRAAVSA
jgi:transcriptional regulator with GAF, ATPase, and Fis domain